MTSLCLSAVAGCIGTREGALELVEGGLKAETIQTLRNIEAILAGCGVGVASLLKVNVYLNNYSPERFAEMNEAYLEFFGSKVVPPRITVGCVGLGLGAHIEMDAEAAAAAPASA